MVSPTAFEYMEWVDVTIDGWKLKDGAPQEVVEAFKLWMDRISREKRGRP